jgi:hypothetical protein
MALTVVSLSKSEEKSPHVCALVRRMYSDDNSLGIYSVFTLHSFCLHLTELSFSAVLLVIHIVCADRYHDPEERN